MRQNHCNDSGGRLSATPGHEPAAPGVFSLRLMLVLALACAALAYSMGSPADTGAGTQPQLLSAFGERPNFSGDGKTLVFIGRNYGDAFELDLASGETKNITRDVPHQGMHRIQYLPDGNFLVTAPRAHHGENTRAHLELWILDRSLRRPLQAVNAFPLEGVAVSREKNLIAWVEVVPAVELKAGQPWQMLFAKPTRRYLGKIAYRDGVAYLAEKQEIMPELPAECNFIEPQDFRQGDSELVFSCLSFSGGSGMVVSVMGYRIDTGTYVTYRRQPGEYNEVEGIAPSGAWAAVECGVQSGMSIPPLGLCRLTLEPEGEIAPLLPDIDPQVLGDVSNPVISPDGKTVAFQKSAATSSEYGEGLGIYLAKLPR